MGNANLVYTCVQLVHNFGAVAVVGCPVAALWVGHDNFGVQYRLGWLMVFGWMAQGASGALSAAAVLRWFL